MQASSGIAQAPINQLLAGDSMQVLEGNTMSSLNRQLPFKTAYNAQEGGTEAIKAEVGDIVRIAAKFGLDYEKLSATIKCESGFRHQGVFGDNGKAYGIAQFHRPTFDRYCEGDYYNMNDQLECMGEMWSQGLMKHWSCYSKV